MWQQLSNIAACLISLFGTLKKVSVLESLNLLLYLRYVLLNKRKIYNLHNKSGKQIKDTAPENCKLGLSNSTQEQENHCSGEHHHTVVKY